MRQEEGPLADAIKLDWNYERSQICNRKIVTCAVGGGNERASDRAKKGFKGAAVNANGKLTISNTGD